MTTPKRIQLRRTKGWRKPMDAIVVARPSKWGNPFKVERSDAEHAAGGPWFVDDGIGVEFFGNRHAANEFAVQAFRSLLIELGDDYPLTGLRGRDLACWCPLDRPCHADVLLERANRVIP